MEADANCLSCGMLIEGSMRCFPKEVLPIGEPYDAHIVAKKGHHVKHWSRFQPATTPGYHTSVIINMMRVIFEAIEGSKEATQRAGEVSIFLREEAFQSTKSTRYNTRTRCMLRTLHASSASARPLPAIHADTCTALQVQVSEHQLRSEDECTDKLFEKSPV